MKGKYITKTFNFENAVVNVLIPQLTPEEKEHRMKAIEKAAAKVIIEGEKRKHEKNNENVNKNNDGYIHSVGMFS